MMEGYRLSYIEAIIKHIQKQVFGNLLITIGSGVEEDLEPF